MSTTKFDLLYEQSMRKTLRNIAGAGLMGASSLMGNPTQPEKVPVSSTINAQSIFDRYLKELIRFEGNKRHQIYKGYYRRGKFYPYKDSKGYLTVGYGHKVLEGEDFSQGITDKEADDLLRVDARKAWYEAIDLIREHNVIIPNEHREEIMVVLSGMVFQMGKNGVRNFKKMWEGYQDQDYQKVSEEMLDSKWADDDSPNRARELAKRIRNL